MIKALSICAELFTAIKHQQWDEASRLVKELTAVLDTYKKAC